MFYALAEFWQPGIEQIVGPDPYEAARVLTPFGFFLLIGICVVCWGIDLFRGRLREIFVISSCMMTAGIVALSAMEHLNLAGVMFLSCLGMFGVGALFVPPIIVLTNLVADDVIGTVVGLAMSIRLIFGQVGYTIFSNIFENKLKVEIPAIVGPAVAKAGLPVTEIREFIDALVERNITAIKQLEGVTPTIMAAAEMAVNRSSILSFRFVYMASLGVGIIAIVASALLPNIRKYMTDRVAFIKRK